MDLILRAYDHTAVARAEDQPLERLLTLLENAGLRDAAKQGAGLDAPEDPFAREALAARVESLIQEGYGPETLAHLRGDEPPDLATLRRPHWPAIASDEAVALREDLVRYLTYGLWEAPEATVAQALATLTGMPESRFLQGGETVTEALRQVMDAVADDDAFATRFTAPVHAALAARGVPADEASVTHTLASIQLLLGPAGRLLRAARRFNLRVIAYADAPDDAGLTQVMATDLAES